MDLGNRVCTTDAAIAVRDPRGIQEILYKLTTKVSRSWKSSDTGKGMHAVDCSTALRADLRDWSDEFPLIDDSWDKDLADLSASQLRFNRTRFVSHRILHSSVSNRTTL